MKLRKILIIVFCLLLIVGCGKKEEETDAIKFKREFEKYNDRYLELEIDDDNIISYADSEKINNVIKNGTGVIFVGDPCDNNSREALKILLSASDSTDLSNIYYIDSLDDIDDIEGIDKESVPVVIDVLKGKIVDYHVGTIDNKDELSEDEELTLYNIYLEGIHKVLQDSCDERC